MRATTALRNGTAKLLYQAGFTAPGRSGRGRLAIVTFHRVLPAAERQAYPFPGLAVTPEELDAFLTYFTEHFDCGALATQHQRFLGGDVTQRPLLALTFDDAQHDNYRYARARLARHRVKASFFVPVVAVDRAELLWHDRLGFAVLAVLRDARKGRERLLRILGSAGLRNSRTDNLVAFAVEGSKRLTHVARLKLVETLADAADNPRAPEFARLMNFQEIAELSADGHEIGSHSMTHRMLPECDDTALAFELAESRRLLQARLAQPIESFCYPNGDSDARTARAASHAGYRRAVTTRWGLNGRDADRFLLRRCDMDASRVRDLDGNLIPALIAFRMSGFYPGLD